MFQNNKSLRSGGILDNAKPLFIPSGVDSLDQIGSPLTDSSSKETESVMKQWKEGWRQTFVEKEKSSEENQENEDEETFAKFPEPAVDAARAEKEKSFERYKRDSSSRARFGVGISPSAHYERSIAKQRN